MVIQTMKSENSLNRDNLKKINLLRLRSPNLRQDLGSVQNVMKRNKGISALHAGQLEKINGVTRAKIFIKELTALIASDLLKNLTGTLINGNAITVLNSFLSLIPNATVGEEILKLG
jgi:hypothetical protein